MAFLALGVVKPRKRGRYLLGEISRNLSQRLKRILHSNILTFCKLRNNF
jgi:hypothetical protein